MTDLVIGILGTMCVCSLGIILSKICSIQSDIQDVSPEYFLISKEHYNTFLENSTKKRKIIDKSPLPEYSHQDSFLYEIAPPYVGPTSPPSNTASLLYVPLN